MSFFSIFAPKINVLPTKNKNYEDKDCFFIPLRRNAFRL